MMVVLVVLVVVVVVLLLARRSGRVLAHVVGNFSPKPGGHWTLDAQVVTVRLKTQAPLRGPAMMNDSSAWRSANET